MLIVLYNAFNSVENRLSIKENWRKVYKILMYLFDMINLPANTIDAVQTDDKVRTGAHNESERGKKAGARHLIKNCTSTRDGRVSIDRLVMADGTRTYSFVLDETWQLEAP